MSLFRSDGWVKSVLGQAIAGAQIYVCTQPTDTSFLPPIPTASIFSDVNGLVPITQPIITDGFGHYDFYAASGIPYSIVVVNSGKLQQIYQDQVPMGATLGSSGAVSSIFGRTGAVVAQASDYSAFYAPIGGGGGAVSSVFGRTGAVVAQTGDYTVSQVIGAGSGTVTTTGSPSTGNLTKFSGSTSIVNGDLSGDVTTAGSLATTLANTTVTPASYTNTNLTVDSKGRITSASNGTSGGSSTNSAPALASFSFVNQGSDSARQTVSGGAIELTIPDRTANWSGLFINQPATPYKVIAQIIGTTPASANSQTVGLYFYDGTKLEGLEFLMQNANALVPRVQRLTNVTTPGTTPISGTATLSTQSGFTIVTTRNFWMQLRNDGTTLFFDYSFDGQNFVNWYSELLSAFITPTQIGFGGTSQTAGSAANVKCDLFNWATFGNAIL
jgi:hypothetical protein